MKTILLLGEIIATIIAIIGMFTLFYAKSQLIQADSVHPDIKAFNKQVEKRYN